MADDAPSRPPSTLSQGSAPSARGHFVTFEGLDGAGKSSHLQGLADWFRAQDREVLVTREPGGSPLAERLRDMVLHEAMDSLSEILLVFAARRDHLVHQIEPALARGAIVLCDRFTDASFAYQGGGRGVALDVLESLEDWVQQGRQPDLTLWFEIAPALAAARRAAARYPDRFEAQDLAFFERVHDAYEARRRHAPQRIVRLDASADRASVWSQIEAAVRQRTWS